MDPKIESIFYIKDKFQFHLNAAKLRVTTFGPSGVEFQSSSFQCLRIILQYLYYFLVSPYKITVDKHERKVYLVSSTLRKVVWVILQASILIVTIFAVARTFSLKKKVAEDPTQLYEVATNFIWLVAVIGWPFCVVSSRKSMNRLLTNSYRFHNHSNHFSKLKLDPCLTFIVCGILIALSLSETIQVIINLSQNGNLFGSYMEWLDSPLIRTLASIFIVTAKAFLNACSWVTFLPGVAACIVIYGISRDYLNHIETLKDSRKQFVTVLNTYKAVKSLVDDVNSVSSFYTFLMITCMMTQFCNSFTFLIGDSSKESAAGEWEARIVLLSYFITLTIPCILAAEAHKKFQQIDKYILANIGKSFDIGMKVEGVILQNEISQNPLGVKAHHFIISYSVMATILSTILTYIFILLQFQSAVKPQEISVKDN